MNLIDKKKEIFFIIILLYSFYDRTLWTDITQWQVDQATTMWVGLNFSYRDMPIGLISSLGIPNPNGMMYLSKLLTKFPNLWLSGYILSLLHLFLITLLGFFLSRENKEKFFIIIIPLILCVSLRSVSTHLVNQWVLLLVNFIFFILLVIYIQKPSLEKLVLFILPILLAPSIYLAGIANSAAFVFCIFFIIFIYPPEINKKSIYKSIFLLSTIIIIFFYFIWLPYLKFVILNDIQFFNNPNIESKKINVVIKTIINFPYWSIFYAAADLSGTFLHNGKTVGFSPFWSIFHFDEESREIIKKIYDGPLSNISINLLKTNSLLLSVQSILSSIILIFLSISFFFKNAFKIENKKLIIFIIITYLFIFLTLFFGAIIGSPEWISGKRLDMQVHLFPFLLLIWFLTPWLLKTSNNLDKYIRIFSTFMLVGFVIINLFVGKTIYLDHMNYKGQILSDADVPLVQKQNAIDFIVKDWRKNSEINDIQIGYFFTDNKWNWIDRFNKENKDYYPGVYIRGREFDYILFRSYGLNNKQEGDQFRDKLNNQYIITYKGTKLPVDPNKIVNRKLIDRLQIFKLKN